MKLSVLLFAGLAEAAREDRLEVEWSGGTAGELLRRLGEAYPELSGRFGTCRVAVDHAFVKETEPVPSGAEVACIPPVAGG